MAADGNSGEYIFRECGVVEQSKHWNQKNLGPLCPQGCEARINWFQYSRRPGGWRAVNGWPSGQWWQRSLEARGEGECTARVQKRHSWPKACGEMVASVTVDLAGGDDDEVWRRGPRLVVGWWPVCRGLSERWWQGQVRGVRHLSSCWSVEAKENEVVYFIALCFVTRELEKSFLQNTPQLKCPSSLEAKRAEGWGNPPRMKWAGITHPRAFFWWAILGIM